MLSMQPACNLSGRLRESLSRRAESVTLGVRLRTPSKVPELAAPEAIRLVARFRPDGPDVTREGFPTETWQYSAAPATRSTCDPSSGHALHAPGAATTVLPFGLPARLDSFWQRSSDPQMPGGGRAPPRDPPLLAHPCATMSTSTCVVLARRLVSLTFFARCSRLALSWTSVR